MRNPVLLINSTYMGRSPVCTRNKKVEIDKANRWYIFTWMDSADS